MRLFHRLSVLALLGAALSPARSAAQAVAGVGDFQQGPANCSVVDLNWPAATARCNPNTPANLPPVPIDFGGVLGSASADADAVLNTVSASAYLKQVLGEQPQMGASSAAFVSQYLTVFGTTNAGDRLTFRFASSEGVTFSGATGEYSGAGFRMWLDVTGYENYDYVGLASHEGHFDNDPCGCVDDNTGYFSPGPNLTNLTVDFGGLNSSSYDFLMQLYADAMLDADGAGAEASAYGSLQLLGIDLVNENGDVRASAYLDENEPGAYLLDVPETTAPEPASVILLATGLAGIVGVARRKRTTSVR